MDLEMLIVYILMIGLVFVWLIVSIVIDKKEREYKKIREEQEKELMKTLFEIESEEK